MELYKDILGYEGFYQISNLGNVKSLSRTILKNGIYPFKSKDKIIKNRVNKYCYVTLCKNNTYKNFYVHRLVAQAFINNNENKLIVNHINGIKTNNRVDNLEWCTYLENTKHAILNGFINQKGINSVKSKLNEKEVLEIKQSNLPHKELSKKYNISKSNISNIKTKRIWKHI